MEFLKKIREICCLDMFTSSQMVHSDTIRAEFKGLPVDIKAVKSRTGDGACQSTDLLKFLIDKRSKSTSFEPKLLSLNVYDLSEAQNSLTETWMVTGLVM